MLTRDLASSACEDLSSNASRGSCFARPVFRPPQPRSDRASAERAGRATRVPDNGRDPQVSNFIASIGLRLLRWFSPLHIVTPNGTLTSVLTVQVNSRPGSGVLYPPFTPPAREIWTLKYMVLTVFALLLVALFGLRRCTGRLELAWSRVTCSLTIFLLGFLAACGGAGSSSNPPPPPPPPVTVILQVQATSPSLTRTSGTLTITIP